jgi:transcriptional regulator with XRE-family HTH domain
MIIQELGKAIREERVARGLTQARLAIESGLSRNTLNRLENGLFPDLGVKKADAILKRLGMELGVNPAAQKKRSPDFVSMACSSAGVSFRKALTAEELVHALLSGKAPSGRKAHFIVLLDEAPPVLLKGLIAQVGAWVKPGKVAKNLQKIARQVGVVGKNEAWKRAA